MSAITVIIRAPSTALESLDREGLNAVLNALASERAADVSLSESPNDSVVVSADMSGFSREESSAIRAGLRSSLMPLLGG